MLSLDVWLHRQLREQLWKGPTAVSAYLSLPIQLIGITLSALCLKALTGPSLCILSLSGLLCVLLIWIDRLVSRQNHNLGLLQFSSQSRRRIKAMGIRSTELTVSRRRYVSTPELPLNSGIRDSAQWSSSSKNLTC
jgi:hypothetical protein